MSLLAPDMSVYAVFDYVMVSERLASSPAGTMQKTYKLIVRRGVLLAGLGELPLLPLEAPPLHFLVDHKLYRAVAHSEQGQRRAAVEPREALMAVDRRQAV